MIAHAAAQGDFGVFGREELADAIRWSRGLSQGMFLTVTCSEFVRFIQESESGPATEGTFMGDYRVRRQQQACRLWPLVDVDYSRLALQDPSA